MCCFIVYSYCLSKVKCPLVDWTCCLSGNVNTIWFLHINKQIYKKENIQNVFWDATNFYDDNPLSVFEVIVSRGTSVPLSRVSSSFWLKWDTMPAPIESPKTLIAVRNLKHVFQKKWSQNFQTKEHMCSNKKWWPERKKEYTLVS